MADLSPQLQSRIDAVKARLPIGDLIGQHVKLSGSSGARSRRGRCPFHNGNSASFSVQTDKHFAHCFGCGWHGDAIRFVRDHFGLSFAEALADCEAQAGISGDVMDRAAAPVQRDRKPQPRQSRRDLIEPIGMGRWIWKHAAPDLSAVRRYFMARGVPEQLLTDGRLGQFRYLADCPCMLWEAGQEPHPGRIKGMLFAPAIVAMVREPTVTDSPGEPGLEWIPVGVHVTYLAPDGEATMRRRKPWAKADDPDPWLPKRRMLGPVGRGAVILGDYRPDAELWIGEGNETVLSAMALAGDQLRSDAVGLATLSLDNLQGRPRRWKNGVLPLYDIRPDPERGPFLVPGHRGRAIGLVDSDMSPLRGQRVAEDRELRPMKRDLTGAERAWICGELFVKGWRAAGCDAVSYRAPAGMDFNDAIQERAA